MIEKYDALALFSGGLDSVLAALTIQAQGLRVLCLHFTSPFFGQPDKIRHWEALYSLAVQKMEVGEEYVRMMLAGPRHGFGKYLNPCMDCKVLMLSAARKLLPEYGASFIISGEVLGQRPMSQRRDALNAIRRDAGVKGLLLRPLSARFMDPTVAEETGLVDRSRLFGFSGRGRSDQLRLAEEYGLKEIPTPAGGCRLTMKDSCRRYFPIFRNVAEPKADDFRLADIGRQFWLGSTSLAIGRDKSDNLALERLARPGDIVLEPEDYMGPMALLRPYAGTAIDAGVVREAAALATSYAPKAVRRGGEAAVLAIEPGGGRSIIRVLPQRDTRFAEMPEWEVLKESWKEEQRAQAG